MFSRLQLGSTSRVTSIIVAAALVVVGFGCFGQLIFLFLPNTKSSGSVIGFQINPTTNIDLNRLSIDYQNKSTAILNGFFASATPDKSDLAVLARQSRDSLLALSLPPAAKDRHLKLILLLDEIAVAAEAKNQAAVDVKFSELKQLASSSW